MYTLLNPVYAYIISGGLFALLLLFLVIAKGDEMFCTNFFTKWIFKTFNPIPGSVLFWNGMFWILFISTGLVWPELALGISVMLSIFGPAVACSIEDAPLENHSWIFASILLYAILAIYGTATLLYYIWKNTIVRFNNWLDTRKIKQDANNN